MSVLWPPSSRRIRPPLGKGIRHFLAVAGPAHGTYQARLNPQHVETTHAEGPSPFVVNGEEATDYGGGGSGALVHTAAAGHAVEQSPLPGSSSAAAGDEDAEQYAECPVEGCGEMLELFEIEYHLELHEAEAGGNRASSVVLEDDDDSSGVGVGKKAAGAAPSSPGETSSSGKQHQARVEGSPSSPRRESRKKTAAAAASSSSSSGKRGSQASVVQAWKQLFASRSRDRELPAPVAVGPPGQRRLGVRTYLPKCAQEPQPVFPASLTHHGAFVQKAELGRFANERKMPEWLASMLEKETLVQAQGM